MSLENEVAVLNSSTNALLNAVIAGHGDEHVEDTTLITVGVDKDFPDIQSAWDSLFGKVVAAPVTIQVDDGVYETKKIVLRYQPYAENIKILGNTANPALCVLDIKPSDDDARPIGVAVVNIRGVTISGFTFKNATVAGGVLGQTGGVGLSLNLHSRVVSNSDTLIFENCDTGIRVGTQSFGAFLGARFTNCGQGGNVNEGSYGIFGRANVVGPGWDPAPGTPRPYGLFCQQGSFCSGQDAVVTDCYQGIVAFGGGSGIWCRGARVENCRHGFLAQWGGLMDAQISISPGSLAQDPDGVGCRAVGCEDGFYAVHTGQIFCQRSVADACNYGFRAERGGHLRADASSALNSAIRAYHVGDNSALYALATQANLSGNAADYLLATGVQGATGGWMYYS